MAEATVVEMAVAETAVAGMAVAMAVAETVAVATGAAMAAVVREVEETEVEMVAEATVAVATAEVMGAVTVEVARAAARAARRSPRLHSSARHADPSNRHIDSLARTSPVLRRASRAWWTRARTCTASRRQARGRQTVHLSMAGCSCSSD